mmetsp:Transcript_1008/g.2186  ORF Transcript_1008/g.2186 Transcript_1008/m.2186 type:complete len:214 (+) Transcript_1008:417-1058(+)
MAAGESEDPSLSLEEVRYDLRPGPSRSVVRSMRSVREGPMSSSLSMTMSVTDCALSWWTRRSNTRLFSRCTAAARPPTSAPSRGTATLAPPSELRPPRRTATRGEGLGVWLERGAAALLSERMLDRSSRMLDRSARKRPRVGEVMRIGADSLSSGGSSEASAASIAALTSPNAAALAPLRGERERYRAAADAAVARRRGVVRTWIQWRSRSVT